MEGREDFLIRPVEQGFPLALPADGIAVVCILAGKEENERDAGEEGENDYGSEKCSHGVVSFQLCGGIAGIGSVVNGFFLKSGFGWF